MPDDVIKIADTQAWLVKARRDLKVAEQLLAQPEPLLDAVAFHCQQAAEKAFKGFLYWHNTPFKKTHNLEELLNQCLDIDATLATLRASAAILTPLATEFRYPGILVEPPLHAAEQALERATLVLAELQQRLPAIVVSPDSTSSSQ